MAQDRKSTPEREAARRLLSLRFDSEGPAEFARRLGVTPQHLNNWKEQGEGLGLRSLAKIAPNLPAEDVLYVLTGERPDARGAIANYEIGLYLAANRLGEIQQMLLEEIRRRQAISHGEAAEDEIHQLVEEAERADETKTRRDAQ